MDDYFTECGVAIAGGKSKGGGLLWVSVSLITDLLAFCMKSQHARLDRMVPSLMQLMMPSSDRY